MFLLQGNKASQHAMSMLHMVVELYEVLQNVALLPCMQCGVVNMMLSKAGLWLADQCTYPQVCNAQGSASGKCVAAVKAGAACSKGVGE